MSYRPFKLRDCALDAATVGTLATVPGVAPVATVVGTNDPKQDSRAIGFDGSRCLRACLLVRPATREAGRPRHKYARKQSLVAQDIVAKNPRRRIGLNHDVK